MNHACLMICGYPEDGTGLEMAQMAAAAMGKRMKTLLSFASHTHQGARRFMYQSVHPSLFEISGVSVQYGSASSDTDHRNVALAWIRAFWRDVERVWIVDTDEFYGDEDFQALKSLVEKEIRDAWYVSRCAYWKGMDWRIDPPEPNQTIFCLDPRKVSAFEWSREPFGARDRIGVVSPLQHHLTAVRSEDGMRKKLDSFYHSQEIIEGWFGKWRDWTPEVEDLHPTIPSFWKRAIRVRRESLPASLWPVYDAFALTERVPAL